MCLQKVYSRESEIIKKEGIGHKVVIKEHDTRKYRSWDFVPKSGTEYPLGEWIEEEKTMEIGLTYHKYEVGFHVIMDLDSARGIREEQNLYNSQCHIPSNFVVIQVQYEKAVAVGLDGDYGDVVVAKRIKNLGEVT